MSNGSGSWRSAIRNGHAWLCITIVHLVLAAIACGASQSDIQSASSGQSSDTSGGCSAIYSTATSSVDAGTLATIETTYPDSATSHVASGDTARPPLLLVLNVPAFRLDVFERGRLARDYRVAVGTRQYPTPLGEYAITSIEWNPWWYPPPSEWARGDKATPPGPVNPMGRVKLYFRRYYFLHGTPEEASIGTASSHGCVRMLNVDAIALARIVSDFGSRPISDATADTLIASAALTRRYTLPDPVSLVIRYDVVELRGDSLRLYPDIYRLARGDVAGRALAVLRDAGYDTATLDTMRLRAAVTEASTYPRAVAVEELLRAATSDHTSP